MPRYRYSYDVTRHPDNYNHQKPKKQKPNISGANDQESAWIILILIALLAVLATGLFFAFK